jgi:hypothetical protein
MDTATPRMVTLRLRRSSIRLRSCGPAYNYAAPGYGVPAQAGTTVVIVTPGAAYAAPPVASGYYNYAPGYWGATGVGVPGIGAKTRTHSPANTSKFTPRIAAPLLARNKKYLRGRDVYL